MLTIPQSIAPHTAVAVRCQFDGSWVEGFEVDTVDGGDGLRPYALRRLHDGAQLPIRFGPDEIRALGESAQGTLSG